MLYIKKFNSDTDRENYIKNNFVSPHLFLNSQNKSLNYFPKYKKLDYISITTTGGQYINLGCKLMENTDDVTINIKFKIKGCGKNTSADPTILNSMMESSPWPGFIINNGGKTNDIYVVSQHEFTGYNYYNKAYVYRYVDGVNTIIDCNVTIDSIPSNHIHNVPTTLFCSLDNNLNTWRFAEADLYHCKIIKGNTIVRNLIPVQRQKDNAVGLWDLENQIFYTSQGNQPFVAGYNE